MRMNRLWQGVRMRQVEAAADPDGPHRTVTLPMSWDDRAADALAALAPGTGPTTLAAALAPLLSTLAAKGRQTGTGETVATGIATLLRHRRAAPAAPLWQGDTTAPGFVLNLAAFHDAALGFDVDGFPQAAALLATACRLLAPEAQTYRIGLAGLDDLLASLGLDYASDAARRTAASLAALFRASVDHALEGDQRDLLAAGATWPAPPPCPIPGLTEAATAARARLSGTQGAPQACFIFPPGPAEALLGIETGGIAPAFSPVRDARLTRAALNRLACLALSPEAALAAALLGDTPLPTATADAHDAMHETVALFLPTPPEAATARSIPARSAGVSPANQPASPPARGPLPARRQGLTRKATIAGHRVFLRTGEYPDGQPGEIDITLPRETPALRGMTEAFAQAVSLGLQHGTPLQTFVDAFAHASFGIAGPVEGDPAIAQASSVIDYVVRTLSATYLDRILPEPELETPATAAPALPLDLPVPPRRGLRLVA